MSAVLGVDGARGSWVGALVDGDRVSWLVLPDIDAALAVDAEVVGVDMPIGLPATRSPRVRPAGEAGCSGGRTRGCSSRHRAACSTPSRTPRPGRCTGS